MNLERLSNLINVLWQTILNITFGDLLDIACVAVILYYLYRFFRDRRAAKLAAGVIFVILFLVISEIFEMHAVQFILQNVFQVGILSLVILFQPEIRSMLEKMGGESLKSLKRVGEQKDIDIETAAVVNVCSAAKKLSDEKTGALIVFERGTKLGDQILTGTIIDSKISATLIQNIFFNKAPLHDGAAIIRNGRLYAAGCFLPLSSNTDVIKSLGSRHRAAVGLSEISDALIVVVSEESGLISVASNGKIMRGYNEQSLKDYLSSLLITPSESSVRKMAKRFRKNSKDEPGTRKDEKGEANE